MTTKDRVKAYCKAIGMPVKIFEQTIGVSNGYVNSISKGLGSDKLIPIIEKFPNLSIEWLLTGRGEMLKSKCPPCNTPGEISSVPNDKDTEFFAHDQINHVYFPKSVEQLSPLETIALYDIEAAANLKSLYDNRHENIIGQIAIPDIPKCDGAVYVRGDSMYPRLKSGDIIVFKFVPNELSSIFYGEMYLISMDLDGDDYLTIKYIKRSERGDKWVKLVSHNPEHDPKDIPLSAIRALALVKVSISMNTMN